MIYGFMHIFATNHWREIVDEQILKMKHSGLLDKTKVVYCGIVGKGKFEPPDERFQILYDSTNHKLFESKTLFYLWQLCRHTDCCVFYVHTKGVSQPVDEKRADWRRMMEYFIITNHNVCLDALDKADIVGVNWHKGAGYMQAGPEVTPHFSGNFWWARGSYIRKLPEPRIVNSRFDAEFWIGGAKPIVAELWRTGLHHHRVRYSEEHYKDKPINPIYMKT